MRSKGYNKQESGFLVRVYCPKGCKDTNGFLFGTQIYYDESSICKAAIHDGKIEDEKGGEFIIKIVDSP